MDSREVTGQDVLKNSQTSSTASLPATTPSLTTSTTSSSSPSTASPPKISSSPSQSNPSAEKASQKAQAILAACSSRSISKLKDLALSPGGFLSDAIRRQAWPVLLGCPLPPSSNDGDDASLKEKQHEEGEDHGSWKELPRHRDEDQVRLDVDRSFIYYPNNESAASLALKKASLSDLITSVLRRQPHLCYFQGYHDICQVLLLVLPASTRYPAVSRLSALRIRDFMLPSLEPAVAQLKLIPSILYSTDRDLYLHLSHTQPFFALSGTLTMYAHDIQRYDDIARLFDALLAREQVFAVYVFAQIVLNRREELFDTPADEPEMLHSILSKLPQPLDLDRLISDAAALIEKLPPEKLGPPWWRGISSSSVLKTARDVEGCARQSLGYGKVLFEKQVRELEWAERKKKAAQAAWAYRRPAGTVALAVAVGLLAVYLRKSPGMWGNVVAFWTRWAS